ncbi:hypothetical protein [Dyadobacter sp. NIV53]|uniref:hypothetical protein n=1 Tax=Dyadobacter sp. NIV53 TaxID=2861765 RepID=UPI001C876915|nr:hypothetical protein [Dyadobacter sp. NIV53]
MEISISAFTDLSAGMLIGVFTCHVWELKTVWLCVDVSERLTVTFPETEATSDLCLI